MRLKVFLETPGPNVVLSYDYLPFLEEVFTSFLKHSPVNYNVRVYKSGFHTEKEHFACFTFSFLQIPRRKMSKEGIEVLSDEVYFFISSPSMEFLVDLASYLGEVKVLEIDGVKWKIRKIEPVAPPKLKEEMRFKLISPFVLTHQRFVGGKVSLVFSRYEDEDFLHRLKESLKERYFLLEGERAQLDDFEFQILEDYVARKDIYKLVTVNAGGNLLKVKGIFAPFYVRAPLKVVKMIYEWGLGEITNLGLGMVAPL